MREYKNNYISFLSDPDSEYHRWRWIIHQNYWSGWNFASFDRKDQLDYFANTIGFSYALVKQDNWRGTNKIYREYSMDKYFVDAGYFWKLDELPENVKSIYALCNGSLVTCYYRTLDDRIEFYRPNPNAKEVYQPLSLDRHIMHQKIYGIY